MRRELSIAGLSLVLYAGALVLGTLFICSTSGARIICSVTLERSAARPAPVSAALCSLGRPVDVHYLPAPSDILEH